MSPMNWVDALAAVDLPADDVTGVTVAGRDVAIDRPLHQGRFDVRDGQPTCEPVTEPLRSYPVKIEGGGVFVQLE